MLKQLFKGETFLFNNPINDFFQKLKGGHFTKTYNKEKNISEKLNMISYLSAYQSNHNKIAKLAQINDNGYKKKDISNLMKRNALINLESLSEDESSFSIESINDIKLENEFEEISECETIIESIGDDLMKVESIGDVDEDLMENRKIEAQKAMAAEAQKNKKPEPETILTNITIPKVNKATKNV